MHIDIILIYFVNNHYFKVGGNEYPRNVIIQQQKKEKILLTKTSVTFNEKPVWEERQKQIYLFNIPIIFGLPNKLGQFEICPNNCSKY